MVSRRCLDGVWKVSGRCLKCTLKVKGGCLEDILDISGVSVICLERVGTVSGKYKNLPVSSENFLNLLLVQFPSSYFFTNSLPFESYST